MDDMPGSNYILAYSSSLYNYATQRCHNVGIGPSVTYLGIAKNGFYCVDSQLQIERRYRYLGQSGFSRENGIIYRKLVIRKLTEKMAV